MNDLETRTCSLAVAADGIAEPCPRDRCPFWEPGGAVLEGGCAVDRLGVDLRVPDLAAYLLDVRSHLEQARDVRHADDIRSRFAQRIGLEL